MRGGEREAAARDVAPDARQRLDTLLHGNARGHFDRPTFGNLANRDACDVPRRLSYRAAHIRRDACRDGAHLLEAHLQGRPYAIEPAGEPEQRPVAAGADPFDNRRDAPLECAVRAAIARQELLQRPATAGLDDLQHD
jgi:hypothetical protein